MAFKKILVPTDGSEFTKAAIREAVELAKVAGGSITALYVIDQTLFGNVPVDSSVNAIYDMMDLPRLPEKIGEFDSDLVEEFFRALSTNCGMNLHLRALTGGNGHHVVEAAFKAFARALRGAVEMDGRDSRVPSSKGAL